MSTIRQQMRASKCAVGWVEKRIPTRRLRELVKGHFTCCEDYALNSDSMLYYKVSVIKSKVIQILLKEKLCQ